MVAFDLWLIFCCGMCGFDGGAGGDGFTVVEVAMFSNALIYLYLCFSISLQKGFFLFS